MSWFQSTNIASFAKTALKEAQKTIDKALDIKEEEDAANGSSGGSRSSTSARAAAVTDMASEFFASWGVAGITSPVKSASNGEEDEEGGSAASDHTSDNTSAISAPPKRCSTMNDLLLTEHHNHNSTSNLTSDVPVTLLATEEGPLSNSNSSDHKANDSREKGHTRSLSDTVFHAFDDSNNLGDLVQVLDEPTPPEEATGKALVSSQQSSSFTSLPGLSTLSSSSVDFTSSVDSSGAVLISCNDLSQSTAVKEKDTISAIPEAEVKSNIELLQEIDLNGGSTTPAPEDISEDIKDESTIETPTPGKALNGVESSGLSDGWDWTSTTDSYLVPTEEETLVSKTAPPEALVPEESCVPSVPENAEQGKACESSTEEHETEVVPEKEQQQSSTPPVSAEHPTEPSSPSVPTSPKLDPVSSSRPSSPSGQDPGGGGVESTPPSSARVSPNFEMVSSGCVAGNAGSSTLPESSRSSSIVVVSGRESTLNSRGTSGAGSSGSSEGGHDIVESVEHAPAPHSPAVSNACMEFPRVTKHKKAASSSSSSDIEVIPSDYSSSSSVPPPPHLADPSTKVRNSDIACQTELALPTKECQVQTEAIQEEGDGTLEKPVDNDISKYVSSEMADLLAEKEAEVQQLREEGEKLSVKQYELSQVIKKLRGKEKENEGVIKGLRNDVASKNLELEKLMKTFISKEGIEQSQNETISKLNQERRKLELKVEQLSSELEDAKDNVDSMKATVENASIEILELKNVISSVQRESAEVDRLTREKGELISRTESLQKEVEHLRTTLNSSQSSHHSRESELKSQISTLTQKVHQLETRLADISSEVADATMPLSLEIEKLQVELKQQLQQADRREQAMQSTINDLQLKLKTASDRERSAKELQIHFQSQHSTLELRIEELESQNRNLSEQLHQKEEIFGKKVEDKTARCQKLEKTVERLTGEVERLSSENDALSNELKSERNNLEVERRRSQTMLDSRENNNVQAQVRPQPHHQRSSSMSTTSSATMGGGSQQNQSSRNAPRNDNSREYSPSEHSVTSEEASYLDEVFDPHSGMLIGGGNANNRSMTPKSFFESYSTAGLIENLQAQLRQRESEVIAFQEELSKNEKIRKQLNEEIANLTMQNQQLGLEMEKLTEMEHKLAELDKNYNAVLQMYGEKVEEADELRMDLEDVKEMYKAQIEQLLKKS